MKNLKFKRKYLKIENSLDKDICFGGKNLLRKITKISQEIQYKKEIKTGKELNEQDISKKLNLLTKYKEEFTKNRQLGYYSIGDRPYYGNRKFSFDLNNKKVIFKPKKGKKIEIEFSNLNKKRRKELEKIQSMCDEKKIPLTIRLTNEYLYITFDNELLNGYEFNIKEYKKRKLNIQSEDELHELNKEFVLEQEGRKLKSKISNRYMSVDLNPYEIGFVICDGDVGNIIYKEFICLNDLSYKLNKSSDDDKQLKQNNKRKYEISEAWNYVFKLATHYKASHFVVEELDFKKKKVKKNETEFNRVVKNIWHRTLTMNLINKYCFELGIIKVGVDPAYSSLIGNLTYNEYDCIASALELCRRGFIKYKKGQ